VISRTRKKVLTCWPTSGRSASVSVVLVSGIFLRTFAAGPAQSAGGQLTLKVGGTQFFDQSKRIAKNVKTCKNVKNIKDVKSSKMQSIYEKM
jgi:hypothetical protein